MQSYTEKVMDDLDALLADLQSTTANVNHHRSPPPQKDLLPQSPRQQYPDNQQVEYRTQSSYSSQTQQQGYTRSETPPPLPPPPPQEILDSIPPPQQFRHNQSYEVHQQESVGYHHSNNPRIPVSPEARFSDPAVDHHPGKPMAANLSNNLSELDQLLQDLNSAKFMEEVDRRNAGNQQPVVNGGNEYNQTTNVKVIRQPPPPVAPKPTRSERNENRNTVDSLLDQLEGVLPERADAYNNRRSVENDNYEYTPERPAVSQGNMMQQQYAEQQSFHHHHNVPGSYNAQPQPSTATMELDDLMATLSEFKVTNEQQRQQQLSMPHARSPSPNSEPSYARPQKSRNSSQSSAAHGDMLSQQQIQNAQQPTGYHGQLESMLGDLQSDMNRHGVSTTSKGTCGACNQPVIGQVITALGKVWHIEHFVCGHCNIPLGTKNFYERDGAAYCEEDYNALFAPKCAYCNGPIVDKCVTAIKKTWHPEHFFCAQCGRQFGEEGFHEKDGHAYCREDYLEMFAPRCGGCGRPILENYISALGRHWHPECFVCRECHQSFGGRSFFDHEGQPYCETHYHLKRGSLCASCQKPITGRCITAMYKKFHPEHFVCAFCLKQLNKGTFKERNDKPYCHPCFVKLFG